MDSSKNKLNRILSIGFSANIRSFFIFLRGFIMSRKAISIWTAFAFGLVLVFNAFPGFAQTKQGLRSPETKPRTRTLKPKDPSWISDRAYFQSGYLGEEVEPVGELIAGMKHRIVYSINDFVFAEFEEESRPRVGDMYLVVENHDVVRHPNKVFGFTDTDEIDGFDGDYTGEFAYELKIRPDRVGIKFKVKGVVKVLDLNSDGEVAKLVVVENYYPLGKDDLLVPFPQHKPEMVKTSYVPPAKDIHGFIVGDRDNTLIGGQGEELYIDVGAAQNVEPGDRFEVYIVPDSNLEYYDVGKQNLFFDNPDLTPHVIGDLLVISVQETSATTIVISSSESLLPGQKIRSK